MRPRNDAAPAPAKLASTINAEHEAAFGKAREALEHARRAGELLLEAKTHVKHGAWLPWLKANCRFSERTARGYMRLAAGWDKLQAKSAIVADLGLRDALELLTDKSPNEQRPATISPEEQRFLDGLRAAGGCSTLAQYDRATHIQRRLLTAALENLDAPRDHRIAHLSVEELRCALALITECITHAEHFIETRDDLICAALANEITYKASALKKAIGSALECGA